MGILDMGVLDLPSSLFEWLDITFFSLLAPVWRLVIWSVVTSLVSMFLYRILSSQRKLEQIKRQVVQARDAMNNYDGDMAGLYPMIWVSLKLSMQQLGITLGPAILSSLPALCLIVWLSNAYGYELPQAGSRVTLQVQPTKKLQATPTTVLTEQDGGSVTVQWPTNDESIKMADSHGIALFSLPLAHAIPVIHKQVWWNSLVGNPNGYLADNTDIESITFSLQKKQYLSFGPDWIRSWEAVFFSLVILFSVAIKLVFKIH